MKKTTQLSVCVALILLGILIGCHDKVKTPSVALNSSTKSDTFASTSTTTAASDPRISAAITSFTRALKENDPVILDSLIGDGGFTVIRNFTSGTYGARGSDIRSFYPSSLHSEFDSLCFPVEKEIPIKLNQLFPEFLAQKVGKIPLAENSAIKFYFRDSPTTKEPATNDLVELINQLIIENEKLSMPYVVKLRDDYLLLVEGTSIDNICTGSFSIFHMENNAYRLKAVLDLR